MRKLIGMLLLGGALSFGLASCSSAEAASADPAHQVSVQAEFDHDKSGDSEIKGSVFNLNNNVDFDNIVLKVDFYDEAGLVIGTRSFVIKEHIKPGESEKFKLDFKSPKGTASANWSVAGADVD